MSRSGKLIHVLVAFLCLGAAIAILRENGLPERVAATSESRPVGLIAAPLIGSVAPAFTLQTQALEDFTLRPTPGATVLNFWATWCQPCRAEMEQLQSVFESSPDTARIVGINLGESFSSVRQWVRDLGLTYTVLLDPQLAVASLYGVRGLPTTLLLDEQMVIQEIIYGPLSAAGLLGRIDSLSIGS